MTVCSTGPSQWTGFKSRPLKQPVTVKLSRATSQRAMFRSPLVGKAALYAPAEGASRAGRTEQGRLRRSWRMRQAAAEVAVGVEALKQRSPRQRGHSREGPRGAGWGLDYPITCDDESWRASVVS